MFTPMTQLNNLEVTKADATNPTLTGTTVMDGLVVFTGASIAGLTKHTVGLANVDNTADADKPVSTATTAALGLKADKTTTYTKTEADTTIAKLIDNAPVALNTE